MAREQDLVDVELRPAPNSMMFNKTPVSKAATVMNNRPAEPSLSATGGLKQTPPAMHKEPLPIKQASADKPKAKKDKGPNKEEVLKKFATILEDYLKGMYILNI